MKIVAKKVKKTFHVGVAASTSSAAGNNDK
jgi:hypothetical protein